MGAGDVVARYVVAYHQETQAGVLKSLPFLRISPVTATDRCRVLGSCRGSPRRPMPGRHSPWEEDDHVEPGDADSDSDVVGSDGTWLEQGCSHEGEAAPFEGPTNNATTMLRRSSLKNASPRDAEPKRKRPVVILLNGFADDSERRERPGEVRRDTDMGQRRETVLGTGRGTPIRPRLDSSTQLQAECSSMHLDGTRAGGSLHRLQERARPVLRWDPQVEDPASREGQNSSFSNSSFCWGSLREEMLGTKCGTPRGGQPVSLSFAGPAPEYPARAQRSKSHDEAAQRQAVESNMFTGDVLAFYQGERTAARPTRREQP